MARGIAGYRIVSNYGHISTIVTADPDLLRKWIERVNATETNPSRHVGFEFEFDYNTFRIGTVQLYVGNKCVIFQPQNKPCPPVLDQFLGDRNNIFVGTNMRSKIERLRAQCPFEADVPVLDLGTVAGFLRERKQGLFASMQLGVIETDWDRLPHALSSNQVVYATLDAFFNLHIAHLLWGIN